MWAPRAEGTSSKPHGEEVPAEGGDEEEGNKEKINKIKIVLVQWPNMAQLGQMINDHDLHHQLENKIDMPVDTANVLKENKVKDKGKEAKEQENLGAQPVEIIEQVSVVQCTCSTIDLSGPAEH